TRAVVGGTALQALLALVDAAAGLALGARRGAHVLGALRVEQALRSGHALEVEAARLAGLHRFLLLRGDADAGVGGDGLAHPGRAGGGGVADLGAEAGADERLAVVARLAGVAHLARAPGHAVRLPRAERLAGAAAAAVLVGGASAGAEGQV